ncbi:hypothetical protein Hanom_Chr02g00121311 [Helianthus anomalus]
MSKPRYLKALHGFKEQRGSLGPRIKVLKKRRLKACGCAGLHLGIIMRRNHITLDTQLLNQQVIAKKQNICNKNQEQSIKENKRCIKH